MFTYPMEGFRESAGEETGLRGNRNQLEHGNSDKIEGEKKESYDSG